MRSVPIFTAQVLRWTLVVVSMAALANSQDVASQNRTKTQLYKVQVSTGQVVADTFVGTHLQGAANLVAQGAAGWSLVGVGNFRQNGDKGLVYSDIRLALWQFSRTVALAIQLCGISVLWRRRARSGQHEQLPT